MNAPRPWEAAYPPGTRWDAPLEIVTLGALLDGMAARWGSRPALEYRGHRIRYDELKRAADRLAAGFLAQGIGPGQPVALLLPNTPWHPLCFLALTRIAPFTSSAPKTAHSTKASATGARKWSTSPPRAA